MRRPHDEETLSYCPKLGLCYCPRLGVIAQWLVNAQWNNARLLPSGLCMPIMLGNDARAVHLQMPLKTPILCFVYPS